MGEIGCVLRYFLWQTNPDRLMVEVPPTSLKKFITGSGNAPKDTIMQQVLKRWGFEAKNNDEADAYGLAMFGLLWMGASIDMPKKNLEAFNKVNKEFKAMRGE